VTHPHRLIVTWRTSIEAAARRADVAVGGPYTRDDTVHHRRVGTLKQLAHANPIQYQRLLQPWPCSTRQPLAESSLTFIVTGWKWWHAGKPSTQVDPR